MASVELSTHASIRLPPHAVWISPIGGASAPRWSIRLCVAKPTTTSRSKAIRMSRTCKQNAAQRSGCTLAHLAEVIAGRRKGEEYGLASSLLTCRELSQGTAGGAPVLIRVHVASHTVNSQVFVPTSPDGASGDVARHRVLKRECHVRLATTIPHVAHCDV